MGATVITTDLQIGLISLFYFILFCMNKLLFYILVGERTFTEQESIISHYIFTECHITHMVIDIMIIITEDMLQINLPR